MRIVIFLEGTLSVQALNYVTSLVVLRLAYTMRTTTPVPRQIGDCISVCNSVKNGPAGTRHDIQMVGD